jgi:hypothetical protein
MVVTYKHASGNTVLCHGFASPGADGVFTGPLGATDDVDTEWAAEYGQPIGAAAAVPYDRGCGRHAFALQVERRFADEDAARAFAIAFAGTLPRGAVSLDVEDSSSLWLVAYAEAVLQKLGVRRVGCSCDIAFLFLSSVPVSVAVTSASPLAGGTVGAAYSVTLAATGGTSYTWSKPSGTLPTGLALSAGGALTGTPSAAGVFTFAAKALDASGAYAVKTFSVTIAGA